MVSTVWQRWLHRDMPTTVNPKLKMVEALVLQHNWILGLSVAQLSQLLQLRLGQSFDNKNLGSGMRKAFREYYGGSRKP
jgi:hypothetical protein